MDLAAVRDAGLVPSTIARAFELRDEGRPAVESLLVERLRQRHLRLRERQLLLVLDNFERVLDAAPLLARRCWPAVRG